MEIEERQYSQIAWHLSLAARYAVAGETALASTETLLAWAVLIARDAGLINRGTVLETSADLAGANLDRRRMLEALEQARDAADALRGHFTSEQRFDLVDLYEAVVEAINGIIADARRAG